MEVAVTHAPMAYLDHLFSDKRVFGSFAGKNPFFAENIVFYVKITNGSDQRVRLTPGEFVVIDDQGNQYGPIGVDYVTAIAESRQPVATATRGVLEGASPGYFGFSFPVGKFVASKPQGRFALIQQSSLQTGYLYPGVIHDGLIAFWSPNQQAKSVRLLITSIKTDFGPDDLPRKSLEFPFTFQVISTDSQPAAAAPSP